MNYRTTKAYKKMTQYHAIELAEGFGKGENATKEEILSAWQYLIDTGACWSLQGFYGRTANDLIENKMLLKASN